MAQFDQELRIADVYAEALFELASEGEQVEQVRAELDELIKLLKAEPEFEKFMTSRALEAEGRAGGLEKMFRNRLSDVVLNALLVMNQHGRSGLLHALHRRFVLRQEDAANEVEVTVTSAVLLSRSGSVTVAVTPAVLMMTPGVMGALAVIRTSVVASAARPPLKVQVSAGRAERSQPGALTPVSPLGRVSVTVTVCTGLGPPLLMVSV